MSSQKVDHNASEFFRFFQIHQMTSVGNNNAAGVGNAGLDRTGMGMHVRYVRIANQNLLPFVGKRVKVTGLVYERNGTHAISVKEIKAAASSSEATAR
jgi:hypothetical protein